MNNICLYFQIHQPFFFKTLRYFEIGEVITYYDDLMTEKLAIKLAEEYIIPGNEFLLKLINQTKGLLKLTFCISGTVLDQLLIYAPEAFTSFRALADTGKIEFTGGTSSHSIVSLSNKNEEFKRQIRQYSKRIEYLFGQQPQLFVNSDLLLNEQITEIASEAGYQAILTNGIGKILQWRSPNYIYSAKNQQTSNILFRNEKISQSLSALLEEREYLAKRELTSEFIRLLNSTLTDEPLVNIYLNYNDLGGELIKEKQLIFQKLITKIIKNRRFSFRLPTEILSEYGSVGEVEINETICWLERFHPEYFPGNDLQTDAIEQLFKLTDKAINSKDNDLQIDWQYLQTTDHFHLMDENHPAYNCKTSNLFNYKSKYDAYINYMNILDDFRLRLKAEQKTIKHLNKIKAVKAALNVWHNT
jgi:alpha-amylase